MNELPAAIVFPELVLVVAGEDILDGGLVGAQAVARLRADGRRLEVRLGVLQHQQPSAQALIRHAEDLLHLKLQRRGHLIVMDIQANAFLQHMVRNIAGVLMAIGCGKAPPGWVEEVLHHRNRTLGGVPAPPFGLYFMAVTYPDAFAIPAPEADIPFMPLAMASG